jgi:hypothetical protein
METSDVISTLAGAFGVTMTWLFHLASKRIDGLEKQCEEAQSECRKLGERINANEILLVGHYVKNERLDALEKSIAEQYYRQMQKLDRIEDKLDRKADKH